MPPSRQRADRMCDHPAGPDLNQMVCIMAKATGQTITDKSVSAIMARWRSEAALYQGAKDASERGAIDGTAMDCATDAFLDLEDATAEAVIRTPARSLGELRDKFALLLYWQEAVDGYGHWTDGRDRRLAESMKADFERLTIARAVQ